MDYIKSGSFSGVASLDLVLTSYAKYKTLKFLLTNVVGAAAGLNIFVRTSSNGGSSFDATTGDYAYAMVAIRTTTWNQSISSTATPGTVWLYTCWLGDPATTERTHTEYTLFNRQQAAPTLLTWRGEAFYSGDNWAFMGAGSREASADVDAIQFLPDPGFGGFSGKYAMYGIR